MPSHETIWDLAVSQNKEKNRNENRSHDKSVLFLGSQGVGKSTIMYRFVDRRETPKSTLALEYSFCRKNNQNLTKEVCHLWELGGGTLYTNLLETPLLPSKLCSLKIAIMVDLSDPHKLWFTLEKLLNSLKTQIEKSIDSKRARESGLTESILKESILAEFSDHPDKNDIDPFPVPLVIIGGKYDLFRDFEPERKKIICKAIRFLAHRHGASLQFYSSKDSGLVKRGHDLLNHLAFDCDHWTGLSQDYNKPLFIPAGSDSLAQIAGTGGDSQFVGTHRDEIWKQTFTAFFPQPNSETGELPYNPTRDSDFREPLIDELRAQKDQELEHYKDEMKTFEGL